MAEPTSNFGLAQVLGSALEGVRFERLPREESGPEVERPAASASLTISGADGARVFDLTTSSRGTLCFMCCSCCSAAFLLASCALMPPVLFFIYLRAWFVMLFHAADACDVPLDGWLSIYLCYTVVMVFWRPAVLRVICRWSRADVHDAGPFRVRLLERLNPAIAIAWLLLGRSLLAQSKTCSETSPGLYGFVQWFSKVAFIPHSLHLALICIRGLGIILLLWLARRGALRPLLMGLADRGFLHASGAASPNAINEMEIVQYDPALFADPEDSLDTRPQGECCICLEAYNGEQTIRRTPCGHMMHHECLKLWLQAARTCPACRSDVEVARSTADTRV
eukprot:TRINITY_DN77671_c0_g1_i1.p1 TRINITY_DN77671_c0_g1~~TRINITY_DN77671_c0_g1_i1.p1  ORF type:complete len:337 (+),score=37.41 TRINITY_DN77671_c0_g1_i1:23-1033(+)